MTNRTRRTIEPVRERLAGPPAGKLRLHVRPATTLGDVIRCQRLIADVYNRHYGVVFTRHDADLAAKVEPYPDRYAMGWVGKHLVAACGLYVERTYVEAFGQIGEDDVRQALAKLGIEHEYPTYTTREYTKLVVDPAWHGRGIGRLFFAMSHSRDLLDPERDDQMLVISCAKRSVYEGLYRQAGVRTHLLKPFPVYKVHERYSSPEDPMESRLIVPWRDIDPCWYGLRLPGERLVGEYARLER